MDRLKLEGTDLGNADAVPVRAERRVRVGIADVSDYKYLLFTCVTLHDFSEKGRGRCLSVGSGDGQNLPLGTLVSELDFPPYGHSSIPDPVHVRKIRRHAGAEHAQVCSADLLIRKLFQDNLRTFRGRRRKRLSHGLFCQFLISVIQYRKRPGVRKKACCPDPAFSGAEYKYCLPFQFHENLLPAGVSAAVSSAGSQPACTEESSLS